MSRNQLRDYVYQVRRHEFQDWETAIRSPPLCLVSSTDQRLFLRFMADVHIEATGELSRMIGWGHPKLLFLTKYGQLNIFIDCTFRCVPKGFYQLMVIIIYSPSHQLYIPIFYILLQSKDEVRDWNRSKKSINIFSGCISTCYDDVHCCHWVDY